MAKIYVKQILAGKITLNDVPTKWFDTVKKYLLIMLENEDITQIEYDKYVTSKNIQESEG